MELSVDDIINTVETINLITTQKKYMSKSLNRC